MKKLIKNIDIINAINIIFINNNQVIVFNIVTTTYPNCLELIIKKICSKSCILNAANKK